MAIAGFTTQHSKKLMEAALNNKTFTAGEKVFVALLTSMPTTNKVTPKELEETFEVKVATITGYKRVEAKFESPTEASETIKSVNEATLEWTGLSGGPSKVVGYAIVNVKLGETTSELCIGAAKLEAEAEIGTGHTPATMAAKSVEVSLK